MPEPALAVVVMGYRDEATVVAAVRSVLAQESPEQFEVVVVTSGGDRSAARVRAAYPDVPVYDAPERLMPGAARNAGVARTTAPIVAFLAADCEARPGWVAARLRAHRAGQRAVASAMTIAGSRRPSALAHLYLLYAPRLAGRGPGLVAWPDPAAHGLSFDRSLLADVGPFPEGARIGEDTEVAERLARSGIPVWFEPAVRTAHHGPPTLLAFLADEYRRGRRVTAALGPPRSRRVVLTAVATAFRVTWDRAEHERRALVLCLPWLLAGASARRFGRLGSVHWITKILNRRWMVRALWRALRTWVKSRPVPSGGRRASGARRVRLIALLAARDEMRFLPGYLENVAPHVDGIVALDDGSTDGTGDFLAAHPKVLEVLRNSSDRPVWDEVANHRALVEAGIRHGADWFVVLDADERVERDFRARAERVIRRGARRGVSAFALRLRDLWGSSDRFRVDGVWGGKHVPRLFRAMPDHEFDTRPLHASKAPLQARLGGRFPRADLVVYHLRMLRPEDRLARRERYETLDAESRWQPRHGYAYLTDENGLQLRRVSRRRGWTGAPPPGRVAWADHEREPAARR